MITKNKFFAFVALAIFTMSTVSCTKTTIDDDTVQEDVEKEKVKPNTGG